MVLYVSSLLHRSSPRIKLTNIVIPLIFSAEHKESQPVESDLKQGIKLKKKEKRDPQDTRVIEILSMVKFEEVRKDLLTIGPLSGMVTQSVCCVS